MQISKFLQFGEWYFKNWIESHSKKPHRVWKEIEKEPKLKLLKFKENNFTIDKSHM